MVFSYPRVASFRAAQAVAEYLAGLGWSLPFDEAILMAPDSPLGQPLEIPWRGGRRRLGNRFAVQPMEGWDGEPDGCPSELTRRRWVRFGRSGAKLIWGGEAVAVLPEARANPNQLFLNERMAPALAALREEMVRAHGERFGRTDDLLVGLQLTHSGRFCRPYEKTRLEPVIAYHHPILDAKCPPAAEVQPISDPEVERIIAAFGAAARLARDIGFDFVDLKHCHGYLGHEFLSAHNRPGRYGGCFENRTRFLRELVNAVRASAKGLEIGIRLSAYDSIPFVSDPQTKQGIPAQLAGPYTWGFCVDPEEPTRPDLSEAKRLIQMLPSLEVRLVNISAGSPYYSPHLQRPALFPPWDAYLPPEDPLVGAARLQAVARDLKTAAGELRGDFRFEISDSRVTRESKKAAGDLIFVSSGWSYFQNYLPHFAQAVVRAGWTDLIGLGRMMLAYPELPADVLEKGRLEQKRICRTFSDCTNGPRNGLVSGCYPLDPFYKARPEAAQLQALKAGVRGQS